VRALHPESPTGEHVRQAERERTWTAEECFRLLVESVKDYAIFMITPEGRIATWNPGAERIKGLVLKRVYSVPR
jgi:PAS domain-containing protein